MRCFIGVPDNNGICFDLFFQFDLYRLLMQIIAFLKPCRLFWGLGTVRGISIDCEISEGC